MLLAAHPETSHPHVAVPAALVALGAVMVVVVVAVAVPARPASSDAVADPQPEPSAASWWGPLTMPQRVTRATSVLLLIAVILAGRVGVEDELENLAPALALGAGWPLLVAGSLMLGTLWRWVDPWDALARLVLSGDPSTPAADVWPAVVLAVPWVWYVGAYSRPLEPRSVGLALAAYTVVTVAGCVALGRVRWLSGGEPVGLVLSWIGLVPRGRLIAWTPPRGAAALLGVVVGGLLFGSVRRTGAWTPVLERDDAAAITTLAMLGACLLSGALATLGATASRDPRVRASVVQTLVPVAAGVVLAVALARNRLFTSVQLLPGLLGDPLGRGWDLLGSPTEGLVVAPLGAAGLLALQLGVVGVAHLATAVLVLRRLVGDERLPAIVVLAASVGLSMTAIALH